MGEGEGERGGDGRGAEFNYRIKVGAGGEIVVSIISARQQDAMTERALDLQKAKHHTLRERACITERLNGMKQAGRW
jgi:hypothetical protein